MTTPEDLRKANGMEEKIQSGWKRIKPKFNTFVVDINDALKQQVGAEIDVVMTGIDPLRKLMDATMASIKGATALYSPISKDAPFMQAHSKEIIQKVKALAALQNEILADLKSLDDFEKKANTVSNSSAASDKEMRSELAALKYEVDEIVKKSDDTLIRAEKLYDDASTASGQRNQKKLTEARTALIDCQGIFAPLTAANAKVIKFDKAYPNADSKVKDQIETMKNDLEYELGHKVLKRIEQLVKDSLQFGQVKKIDSNKAAALIKITDKKEIQELDKLLNTPQVDLEKALTPLAKKHQMSGKTIMNALEKANMF